MKLDIKGVCRGCSCASVQVRENFGTHTAVVSAHKWDCLTGIRLIL